MTQRTGPTPGAALLFVALAVVFGALLYHAEQRNSSQDSHARQQAQFSKEVACAQAEQTIGASRVRQVGANDVKETVAHWRGRLIRQRRTLIIASRAGQCPRVPGLPPFVVQASRALDGIDTLLRETGGIPTRANPTPTATKRSKPSKDGAPTALHSAGDVRSPAPQSTAPPSGTTAPGHTSHPSPAGSGSPTPAHHHVTQPQSPPSQSPSPAPASGGGSNQSPAAPVGAAPANPVGEPSLPPVVPPVVPPVSSPSSPPVVGVEVPAAPVHVCVPGLVGVNC